MTEPKIDKFPIEFKEMYRNFLSWLYRNFFKEVPKKPLFHYATQNGLLGMTARGKICLRKGFVYFAELTQQPFFVIINLGKWM